MFLLFGINLCSSGCCRMQGSLRVISLMFAPRDPHLTFPHLSLHKINPFLAPPRLTSLTSAQSTLQQIKSNTHATALTDTTRVTQFFLTQNVFCALHFLKRLNFLPKCLLFQFHWIELFVWFRWKKDMFWSISLKVFTSFVQLQLTQRITKFRKKHILISH